MLTTFFDMVCAGLAGKTPHFRSATITALSRLYYKYSKTMDDEYTTTMVTKREITVAMAAPWSSRAGMGPQPKMKMGSSIILITLARIVAFIGVLISPLP